MNRHFYCDASMALTSIMTAAPHRVCRLSGWFINHIRGSTPGVHNFSAVCMRPAHNAIIIGECIYRIIEICFVYKCCHLINCAFIESRRVRACVRVCARVRHPSARMCWCPGARHTQYATVSPTNYHRANDAAAVAAAAVAAPISERTSRRAGCHTLKCQMDNLYTSRWPQRAKRRALSCQTTHTHTHTCRARHAYLFVCRLSVCVRVRAFCVATRAHINRGHTHTHTRAPGDTVARHQNIRTHIMHTFIYTCIMYV